MKKVLRCFFVLAISVSALLLLSPGLGITADEQMKLPPVRKIPGLTDVDKFPQGCVDCHINMPYIKQDERISTLMARWKKTAGPELLKKAQAAVHTAVKLKGIHPNADASLKNIPAACMGCHSRTSKTAPRFDLMIHLIHLKGGDENHFLTIFQGECTHCHKMNDSTGAWMMPSGPEK